MKAKAPNDSSVTNNVLCNNCDKPLNLCVCKLISALNVKTRVLILQHPQEPDKLLGSAKLANLIISGSILRIGLSWQKLEKALGKDTDRSEWAVLYVGSVRLPKPDKTKGSQLLLINKKGKIISEDNSFLKSIKGIIILDGTWSQAKTLWWRNAWLSKLKRCVLIPPAPSLYGALRREPRPESLSTLETLAYSLSVLEKDEKIIETMLTPFRGLLSAYRAGGKK